MQRLSQDIAFGLAMRGRWGLTPAEWRVMRVLLPVKVGEEVEGVAVGAARSLRKAWCCYRSVLKKNH